MLYCGSRKGRARKIKIKKRIGEPIVVAGLVWGGLIWARTQTKKLRGGVELLLCALPSERVVGMDHVPWIGMMVVVFRRFDE